MRRIIILWHILLLPFLGYSQICGLSETILINPGATVNVPIEIAAGDLVNENLADPNQGLCGIELQFRHGFVESIAFTLVSPSGQSVQLTGPTTTTTAGSSTIGAFFNIRFVAASIAAQPDPGFTPQWNNNQTLNFQNDPIYDGSYYPFIGNLEDFNTGNTFGTWTLIADNSAAFLNQGALLSIRLIFCDDTGLDCCFADPGQLLNDDLLTCVGNDTLNYEPRLFYSRPRPDATDFGYTYLISQNDIIIGYDSTGVNLENFPAGTYQICGLSYQRSDSLSIPQADGQNSLSDLFADLTSLAPSFCAELTTDCQEIIIEEAPAPVDSTAQICEGDTFTFLDSTYTQSGNYPHVLTSVAGCDSIVNIILTVIPTQNTQIDSTICNGESVQIGPSTYSLSGNYQDTLSSSIGCDSIVVLNLEVIPEIRTALDTAICLGDSLVIGNTSFLTSTNTAITLTAASGCDSIIDLSLEVLEPVLNLAPVNIISCANPSVLLDVSASVPAGQLTYAWFDNGGNPLGSTSSILVDQAGDYRVVITQSVFGTSCTLEETITVTSNQTSPVADAGTQVVLDCQNPEGQIGGTNSSTGAFYSYLWIPVQGSLPSRTDTAVVPVNQAGVYRLIVEDTRNGCRDSSNVVVVENKEIPGVNAGFDQEINCGNDLINLDGSNSVQQPNITYQWSGPCLLGRTDSIGAQANCAGEYTLLVTNTENACSAEDTVLISLNPAAPTAILPDTAVIDCSSGTVLLDGSASSQGFFAWSKDGTFIASGSENVIVDDVGLFFLSVSNQDGSCTATDSIVVVSDCQPEINILPPARITCQNPSTTLDAGNSNGQSLEYEWIAPDLSCIVQGQGTSTIEVSCGGSYTLILTNTSVLLRDTQTIAVDQDTNIPIATVGPPDTLNCIQTEVVLDGSGSSTGTNIVYRWTRVGTGEVIAETATATTGAPGTYRLQVIDTLSQCEATANLRIVEFNLPISLNFNDTEIACGQDTFPLRVLPTPLSDFYTYQWTGPDIAAQADSATALITGPGDYAIQVQDQRSKCEATAQVNVSQDLVCGPCLTVAKPDPLTCDRTSLELQATYCTPCTGCVLQWTSANGSIVANGNTLQPTVDQAGIYQLTAIDQLGFETIIEVEVIADNEIPIADAGPDRLLTCDSASVTLGNLNNLPASNLWYAWTSPDNVNFPTSNSTTISVSETGNYVLQVSNSLTGCSMLDTVLVSYDTIVPIAVAGPDRSLSCNETFVILNGSGSSTGNTIIYSWTSSNPGNCLQGAASLNPIVNCAGTYYLEVENVISGCRDIDSLVITSSSDIPVLNPLPDTSLSCLQDTVLLIGNIPADGNFSFEWCEIDQSGQVLPLSCQAALELEVDSAGIYQFSVTNDATGCQAAFIVEVSDLRAAPEVNAGNDQVFSCSDDSLNLDAVIGPDPNLLDFQWRSLGNFLIQDGNTLKPVIFAPDTLVLTAINRQTNCAAQDTIIIRQDINAPLVDAGPDLELTCAQTTLRLQGSGTAAGGGNLTYTWTTDSGNIQADADTPSPLINRPGIYMVNITDTQNNCSATDAVEVIDRQTPPQANVIGLDTLQFSCDVDSLLLDASSSSSAYGNLLDYSWAVVSTGSLIGDTTQATIFSNSIGTYRLVVRDRETACLDSLQFTLSAAFGAPVIQIATPEQFTCTQDAVSIDAGNSEFGAGYRATWFDEQGNILLTDNLQLTVTSPGTYTLQIDNNNTGCSNISAPIVIGEDINPPMVNIAIPDLLDCAITSVRLDGSASSQGPAFQYQWTSADGLILDAGNQAISAAGAPGIYQLQITNTQNGCSAAGTTQVEAITTPIIGIQFETTSPTCTDASAGSIQINDVQGGTPPFTYMLNDGVEFSTGTFTQLGAGIYNLSIRDTNGCEWEEEIQVLDVAPIAVDLGPDITIAIGDSIELIAQTSESNILSYQWDPRTESGFDEGPSQVVAPVVSTSYGITVTDSNGCVASDRVQVLVGKTRAFYIPNVFSPNGDGNNDLFTVLTGPEVVNIPSFRIYDRWGHLVYDQQNIPPNNPNLGWDGRHNGQLMNAAVFVYLVELEYQDGWVEVVKGDVTLMR